MNTSIIQPQQPAVTHQVTMQPLSIETMLNQTTLPQVQLQLTMLHILGLLQQCQDQSSQKNMGVLDELEEVKKKYRQTRLQLERLELEYDSKVNKLEFEKKEALSVIEELKDHVADFGDKLVSCEQTASLNQCQESIDAFVDREKKRVVELEFLLEKEKYKYLISEVNLDRQTNLVGKLEKDVEELKKNNQEQEMRNQEKLSSEIQLTEELKLQKERADFLEKQLKNFTVFVGSIEFNLENKTDLIQQLTNELDEKSVIFTTMQHELVSTKKQCREESLKMNVIKFELNNKTNLTQHLKLELIQKDNQLSSLQEELNENKKCCLELNHKINNIQSELENKTSWIQQLRYEINEKDDQFTALQQELSDNEKQCQEQIHKMNSVQSECNNNNTSHFQQLASELEKKESKLLSVRQELDKHKESTQEQDKKIKNMQSQLNTKGNQISQLTLKLEKKESELSDMEKKLINCNKKCEDNINKMKQTSNYPLNKAAQSGDLAKVKLLLDAELDVETEDTFGWRPLHNASYKGYLEIVKLLKIFGANLQAQGCDKFGDSPLHLAAINNHENVVLWLLDEKVPVDIRNNFGSTPLVEAAWNGRLQIAKLLLNRGAAINAQVNNYDDRTPLHSASMTGKVDVAQLLLDRGANLEARTSNNQRTPLHMASEYGELDVVKLLVRRGANKSARDKYGDTAEDLATRKKHTNIVNFLASA